MANLDYESFLETKRKTFIESGFEISEKKLHKDLKDFQKFSVKVAIEKGKFALFQDCGLGKSFQQLEWANQVSKKTKKKVLILAPLAIIEQTKNESLKFGINIDVFDINNYDQLKNIDVSKYAGVVLDESSILKGRDGNDEKHIAPLQLDTIERILHLYSNEGETVFSPFGGIGSEGCCGIKMNEEPKKEKVVKQIKKSNVEYENFELWQ